MGGDSGAHGKLKRAGVRRWCQHICAACHPYGENQLRIIGQRHEWKVKNLKCMHYLDQ